MNLDKSKVIKLRSFNSSYKAELYKALLESAGIDVRLQNDLAAQVLPVYGQWMEVNLLVREEDREKAEEILAAEYVEFDDDEAVEAEDTDDADVDSNQ